MTFETTSLLHKAQLKVYYLLYNIIELVQSNGFWCVTTPLITPVMGICCPGSFGKDCFDMLKSIGFGDLVRLFPSSRRSDRVYLG